MSLTEMGCVRVKIHLGATIMGSFSTRSRMISNDALPDPTIIPARNTVKAYLSLFKISSTFLLELRCFESLFSFDMLSLSNELFASTIMLFVINYVFKEIEFRIQRDDTVLKIGFYCGVASLFVFSYIIFAQHPC